MEMYETVLKTIFKEKYGQEQAKDAVYYTLKEGVVTQTIPPHTTLNSTALSKLFYLSRTPVEHALYRLCNQKLIVANQQNGYSTYTYNFKEARDSNEFMLYLYLIANAMAGKTLDFYYENLLEKKLDKLDKILDLKEYLYEGNKFHQLVAESTGNENLISTLDNEREKSSLIPLQYDKHMEETAIFIEEHKKLDQQMFEAICRGDSKEIQRTTMEHNDHMINCIFKYILIRS